MFVPPAKVRGPTVTIDSPRELRHLRAVLRLGVGDRLICCDGTGAEYVGTIRRASPARLIVAIDRRREQPQAAVKLWLAQALPKGDRFEWIVQKATELGAARLSPLITRHTVVRLTPEQAERKRARWQRIAQEAAAQCRRATVPAVDVPQGLEPFLRAAAGAGLLLMPTLAVRAAPLGEVLAAHRAVQQVVALIGPEGDFSPDEVALAQRCGARAVSLGPRTLRTETAALATLAILSYALVP